MTFTDKEFNSNDGMVTFIWGPSFWNFLHMVSFAYPTSPSQKDKKNYMAFIKQLKCILPCKHCRDNLTDNLKTVKLSLSSMKSQESFSKFVYDLHNQVNVMLGKQPYLTFSAVQEKYDGFRLRCDRNDSTSKCVIQIVPRSCKDRNFEVDPGCVGGSATNGECEEKNSDDPCNDTMNPHIWGPCLWHFLHCISFNYPVKPTQKNQRDYKKFIKLLGDVLPDPQSRSSFTTFLTQSNFKDSAMKSRASFSKWMVKFHNVVNEKVKGTKLDDTYEYVRDKYENFRSRCLPGSASLFQKKTESGCTDSLYGLKAKSTLQIVPKKSRKKNMRIDPKCVVKRSTKSKSKMKKMKTKSNKKMKTKSNKKKNTKR